MPRDPISALPRVPYVCDEQYDGGDWLTYPIRAGWPQVVPSAEYPDYTFSELMHPSDDQALERFLQTWIFFGLLYKVLNEHELFDAQEYVAEDAEGLYLHTRILLDRLSRWQHLVIAWPEKDRIALYNETSQCLDRAWDTMVIFISPQAEFKQTHPHPGFHPAIKAALAALCDTLSEAIDQGLRLPGKKYYRTKAWATIGWLDAQEITMRLHGWCPSEISHTRSTYNPLSAKMYLQHLRKPHIDSSHTGCDAVECMDLQINQAAYQPKHTAAGCECECIGPRLDQIVRCLEGESFPVLRLRGDQITNVAIETVQCGLDTPYVALSHVWADGLGNPREITLPRCQLLRLKALVSSLRGHQPYGQHQCEDRDLLLWCDSLCCPVEDLSDPTEEQRRQKTLALKKMRSVYAEAAYVLVLDRSLEIYNLETVGPLEAAMRIFTSPWWRRLWTFQEAFFAKSLLIVFRDNVIDLRDLMEAALLIDERELVKKAIALDVRRKFRSVEPFRHGVNNGAMLSVVVDAIQHRGVSVPEDEPLCVSTVLNLDAVAMAASPRHQRMETLWRSMAATPPGIPKSMIFVRRPRLQSPGFRWAPATFRAPAGPAITDAWPSRAFIDDETASRGILTRLGLVVKISAWQMRMAEAPKLLLADRCDTGARDPDHVFLRHPGGKWFLLMERWQITSQPNISLGSLLSDREMGRILILEDEVLSITSHSNHTQRGLIASIHVNTDGCEVARSEMVVTFGLMNHKIVTIFEAAHDRMLALRNDPSVQRLERLAKRSSTENDLARQKTALIAELDRRAMEISQEAMEDAELAQTIRNASEVPPEVALAVRLTTFYIGGYAVVGKTFGPESEWCVD